MADDDIRATVNEDPDIERVLEVLRDGNRWHPYPLSRAAGLRSGRLYRVLIRLEQDGRIASGWANSLPGKPRRRWYELI
jgi:DNA-binding PadR family transcriptional regulator